MRTPHPDDGFVEPRPRRRSQTPTPTTRPDAEDPVEPPEPVASANATGTATTARAHTQRHRQRANPTHMRGSTTRRRPGQRKTTELSRPHPTLGDTAVGISGERPAHDHSPKVAGISDLTAVLQQRSASRDRFADLSPPPWVNIAASMMSRSSEGEEHVVTPRPWTPPAKSTAHPPMTAKTASYSPLSHACATRSISGSSGARSATTSGCPR